MDDEAATLTDLRRTMAEKARSLAPTPALLLEVFAIAGCPLKKTDAEMLAHTHLPKGTRPSWIEQALCDLVNADLLVEFEGSYACHPDWPEDLALSMLGGTACVRMVKALRKMEALPASWQKITSEQGFRQFRWSFLAQDKHQSTLHQRCLDLGLRPLAGIGSQVERPETLLDLPAEVGLRLTVETLTASITSVFPAEAAFQAFETLSRNDSASASQQALLAYLLAARGMDERLEQLLSHFPMPKMEQYRNVLKGDLSHSSQFPSDWTEMQAVDFVLGVAMLARGEALPPQRSYSQREVDLMLVWLSKARTGSPLAGSPVAELVRKGLDRPDAPIVYRPHLMLTLHWAGYSDELASLRPQDWARKYREAGYLTFANWLERISGASGDTSSPYSGLVDILPPVERWRDALLQLEAWVGAPIEAESEEVERRLVWEIDPFGSINPVEPRIQKATRKGGWSSGQSKRLEELWQDVPSFSDEHDAKVFGAVAEVRIRQRGFITYPDPIWDKALLALVGHPRVQLRNGDRIELVMGEPSLEVLEQEGTYRLTMLPSLRERPGIVAVQEAPHRVVLYEVSKRLANLSALIGRGLEIPTSEKDTLKSLLSRMDVAELSVISDLAPASGQRRQVEPDDTLRIRLTPRREGLAVQVRVAPLGHFGPLLVPAEGHELVLGRDPEGQPVQSRRSLENEREHLVQLRAHAPLLLGTDFVVHSAEAALSLLEELHELPPGVAIEWPEGQRFELRGRLGTLSWQRLRDRSDWFELDGEVTVSEELVLTLSELLALKAKAGGRFVQLDDGTYLALTKELHRYLDRLERLATDSDETGLKLSHLASLAALEGQTGVEVDDVWTRLKAKAEGVDETSYHCPRGFCGDLRPYQLDGYRWLRRLANWGVGACLADDMGLGKTIQILALLLSRSSLGPALVVAPTSVGWNWRQEAARFTPELKIDLLGEIDRQALLSEVGPGQVVVASYGLLVREVEALAGVRWSTMVLDEAQAIKNSQTQRAKATLAIPADFRIAATGTPVENHLEELWSLFRWLNPGLLGSQRRFNSTFPAHNSEAQQDLSRLIRPFVLRRTKGQVLRELPARTDVVLRVDLSEAEMALYESMRREAVKRFSGDPDEYIGVLAELTRLRRVCCHPALVVPDWQLPGSKLEHFRTLTDELIENGHRALVFSQFVSHLKILAADLQERGVPYQYLDGSTTPAARQAAVNAFQTGSDPLFLISLKAGGTGLNLTAADYVLHMDPWWNPAVEDQASDRAHRLGQLRPVTVYRLVARGTVEERIVALHERKRDLAERLLEGTDSAAKLTTRELLALM